MDISFYTAAVGAIQQQARMDVHANNIANINTDGFRAEKPEFSSLMYGSVNGVDGEKLPRGSGAFLCSADTDFKQGPAVSTGRSQDYAISGDGFFALLDPASGTYSYTRDGSFTLSEFPQKNEAGQQELGMYLSDGMGRFVIGSDGRMIRVDDPDAEQPVGIFDFANTNGMQHSGENCFTPVKKNGDLMIGSGKVIQGSLEASNADLATELTKVIEAQRSFSYALKMVQTSDEIESTVIHLR